MKINWSRPATKWDFIIGCIFFVVVNGLMQWWMADYRWKHSPQKAALEAQLAEINRPSPILPQAPLQSQGSPAR